MDDNITIQFRYLVDIAVSMMVKFGAIAIISPIFILPGSIIALVGGLCGRIYMRAQLPIKREMSKARAPVLGHFNAAISGLSKCLIPNGFTNGGI